MKMEKFISLSLCNASIFLIFATAMTSCEKRNFQKFGHFSKVSLTKRSPASTQNNEVLNKFNSYQDAKQIYLYCSLNAPKLDQCYKHHFNQVISTFSKKYKSYSKDEINEIKKKYSFENTQEQIVGIKSIIIDKLDPEMFSIVKKQKEFCKENATKNEKRCLLQFKNKETVALLNKYQKREQKLNAHEYLYMHNFLVKEFENRLLSKTVKNEDALTIPSYDHKGVQTGTSHL